MTQARIRQSFRRFSVFALTGIFLSLLFSGCGSSGTATGSTTPPTVTITASPTSITAGASSSLTVVATSATTVTITGTDGSSYTMAAAGGAQSVTPAATTTYTVTATGASGTTAVTATATVTVTAVVPTGPAVTMTASPTTIVLGGSSTLTVVATRTAAVAISGSDGSSYIVSASGGTKTVTPSATTTYTVTATGAAGTTPATATATVTVTYLTPTVTITANPTSIMPSQSSLLTVTASDATKVTVTGTDGSSYNLTATGGLKSVRPAATTTYTATAVDGAGTPVTATAVVTVSADPAPTVTISASPSSIVSGGTSTLTVTASNTTQNVIVTGTDGSSYTLSAVGGTQAVTPTATTVYTASGTGDGGTTTNTATVTITPNPPPAVTITASPTTINLGGSSTLTVTATNSTGVSIAGSDGSTYPLTTAGTPQTQVVTPTGTAPETVTYTVTATGTSGTTAATDAVTVTVNPAGSVQDIQHVIFMLQENHTFDNYFGMLNPYRKNPTGTGTCPNNSAGVPQCWNIGDDGNTYNVDGIDDKLSTIVDSDDEGDVFHLFPQTSTCIDDETSDWLASEGDVNRYDFEGTPSPRPIDMNGFVHNAEGYAKSCALGTSCSGSFTDTSGARSMGYYDQNFLNYYYFMASEFAVSDRWFSPVADKSVDNRIATFSGGTTQGLVKDPGNEDHLTQLAINTIFSELSNANVSWKIYYSVTQSFCNAGSDDCTGGGPNPYYPASDFESFQYSYNFIHLNAGNSPTGCNAPLLPSSVAPVNDPTNSFCIDITHIAPIGQFTTDLQQGTLPAFAFIEAGYGGFDEHPGSGQSILTGQYKVAQLLNSFMESAYWPSSVFFLSYDEGGGPYDHVPPVPGSSNDNTILANMGTLPAGGIPDIGGASGAPGDGIAVNPDIFIPNTLANCPYVPPNYVSAAHCDLQTGWPGATSTDAAAENGFAAQLGFRLPNFVVSPFTRKHYVSHIPMDHTAVIQFVESLFIDSNTHLTDRDAAQPNLLDFFDFTNVPWATPPTPPLPVTLTSLQQQGKPNPCQPTASPMGPPIL